MFTLARASTHIHIVTLINKLLNTNTYTQMHINMQTHSHTHMHTHMNTFIFVRKLAHLYKRTHYQILKYTLSFKLA